ncbi:transcriptional repressor [Dehalobacterium formicoaceticum]|uniref:Fur family transcriptional regulator n=1 Tax=Dehalobacterium formicoaceticum TaxID=51515 RepID=UPI0031F6712D
MKPLKRMTKQRKIILDVLQSTTCHPTADWIYEQARKELPDISLGTIYRNLQHLVQEEEIQELNYGSTFRRFDGNTGLHYHFVCRSCGQVMDVDMPVLRDLNGEAAQVVGGLVEDHRLEFYGICRSCLDKNQGIEGKKECLT